MGKASVQYFQKFIWFSLQLHIIKFLLVCKSTCLIIHLELISSQGSSQKPSKKLRYLGYRVPPKETQWVLFEFVCKKSLSFFRRNTVDTPNFRKYLMWSQTGANLIQFKNLWCLNFKLESSGIYLTSEIKIFHSYWGASKRILQRFVHFDFWDFLHLSVTGIT